jgi:hypothetical protein
MLHVDMLSLLDDRPDKMLDTVSASDLHEKPYTYTALSRHATVQTINTTDKVTVVYKTTRETDDVLVI